MLLNTTKFTSSILVVLAGPLCGRPSLAQETTFPTPTSVIAHSQSENYMMRNLSYLLGWQVSGLARSTSHLEAICEDLGGLDHGRWKSLGLVTQFVELTVCANAAYGMNPIDTLPHQSFYETEVMLTQLLYSFNSSTREAAYEYLCVNIRRNALSTLYLDDERIIAVLCHQAEPQGSPSLRPPSTRPTSKMLRAYRDSMSALFGLELTSTASNKTQLTKLCHEIQAQNSSMIAETLNPAVVKVVVCSTPLPLSIMAARDLFTNQISATFLGVVAVMSNAPGYLDWLCYHLDVAAMDSIGLVGLEVKMAVCGLIAVEQFAAFKDG